MSENLTYTAVICAQECERQHVGLDRVAGLIEGIVQAREWGTLLTLETLYATAYTVEPDNKGYPRTVPVSFPDGTFAIAAENITTAMQAWIRAVRDYQTADHGSDTVNHDYTYVNALVKEFLDIHPFLDGNGRTGFLLYNYLKGTLHKPEPLPYYYGENPDTTSE